MPTVVQDVSGDSALQTAIAALKAKIEGAEESSEIAQAVSQINMALAGKQNVLTFDSAPSSGSSNPVTSGGVKTALDGKQDTLIFDAEPTAESTKPITSGGVKAALDDMYSEISDHIAAAEEDIDIRGGAIYESASGSLIEIADGGDNLPMKSAVVTMEPIQEGSGDPSPDNVRPISGRTGVSVVRCGKNLFGGLALGQSIVNAINVPQSSYLGEDEVGKFVRFSAGYSIDLKNFTSTVKFKENTRYTIILKLTQNKNGRTPSNIRVRYTDGSMEAIGFNDSTAAVPTTVFTSAANKTIKNFETFYGGGSTYVYYENSGIFEGVVTEAVYEPYKGNTYSVNWETEAGTVYGGYVDVVSGKLTIDWYSIPSNSWSAYRQNNGFVCYRSLKNPPIVGNNILSNMISKYGSFDSNNMTENIFQVPSTTIATNTVCMALDESVDISELQVIYKTPNSTEIQLTQQEIRTLLGENNIWSDGGDMEVEYPADTKMYIDTKIAEAIAAALA